MTLLKIVEREYEITPKEFVKKLGLKGKVTRVYYYPSPDDLKKNKIIKIIISTEDK